MGLTGIDGSVNFRVSMPGNDDTSRPNGASNN